MMSELKVLEETNHPNIPRVFELFEDNQNYYIITELISGGNMLEKLCAERENLREQVEELALRAVRVVSKNSAITHPDAHRFWLQRQQLSFRNLHPHVEQRVDPVAASLSEGRAAGVDAVVALLVVRALV